MTLGKREVHAKGLLRCGKLNHRGVLLEVSKPVLAPDHANGADRDASFSLASEIIELVVLTRDDAFLETLRAALGSSRRLWHVPTADKVGDLLLAGEVGIVVLDAQALEGSADLYIAQIKRQFPDLVIVLAGDRTVETGLAGLISSGDVYRFIHKPMSPGRAKLFVESAVRKFEEQRPRRAAGRVAPAVVQAEGPRTWMIGAAVAVAIGILAVTLLMHQRAAPPSVLSEPSLRAPNAPSPLLARAASALAANRLVEPSGDNALELFLQILARNPGDTAARAGIAEIHDRLYARAESALLEERFDQAAAAIETARKAGVEKGRIALLTTELAKARTMSRGARARSRPQAAASPNS